MYFTPDQCVEMFKCHCFVSSNKMILGNELRLLLAIVKTDTHIPRKSEPSDGNIHTIYNISLPKEVEPEFGHTFRLASFELWYVNLWTV